MNEEAKTSNFLAEKWANIDQHELRFLLENYIGGPGQYDDRVNNPNKFYLPLAGSSCKVVLTFKGKKLISIERGPAFVSNEWEQVSDELDNLIYLRTVKIGREFSFSSFRVLGSWFGRHSGIQILPPPDDAPQALVDIAEHPFILEFPIVASDKWSITNYRRQAAGDASQTDFSSKYLACWSYQLTTQTS